MDCHAVDQDVVKAAPFPCYAKEDSAAIAALGGHVVYRADIEIGEVNVLVSCVCRWAKCLNGCVVAATYRQVLDVVVLHSIQLDGVLIARAAIENGKCTCSVGVDRDRCGTGPGAVGRKHAAACCPPHE